MNANEINISQWMSELINGIFEDGEEWLDKTFQKCLTIKRARTEVSDYGCEWAFETLIGDFLLRHMEEFGISNLRINQRSSMEGKARPDFSFRKDDVSVIVELKQTINGSLRWTKDDVGKTIGRASAVFFLTVSYPFDGETTKQLSGAAFVAEGVLAKEFRYSLFRKSDLPSNK